MVDNIFWVVLVILVSMSFKVVMISHRRITDLMNSFLFLQILILMIQFWKSCLPVNTIFVFFWSTHNHVSYLGYQGTRSELWLLTVIAIIYISNHRELYWSSLWLLIIFYYLVTDFINNNTVLWLSWLVIAVSVVTERNSNTLFFSVLKILRGWILNMWT